ncbi:hypothetical protein ACF0H5_002024 [Mactra antiquata]
MTGFELETPRKRIPNTGDHEAEVDEFEGVSSKNRSWRNWFLGIVGLLYFMGMNMALFIISQYIYRRIQINEYPNKTFETGISFCGLNYSNPDVLGLAHVQELAAGVNLRFTLMSTTPSIIVNVILGSYTDKFGRKFLMLFSMSGTLLRILICLLGAYINMDIELFGIAFVVEGLTGQVFAWLLASYAYVSDITHRKNRAIGIVLNAVGVGLGTSVSTLVGGPFLQAAGFTQPLILSAALVVLGILITVFLLPESYPKEKLTVVGSLGMLTIPMTRSIMTRMTGSDRQGALAASISFVETSCNLIANVGLNAIYQATVAYSRGATFFVMAACNGLSFILLIILKIGSRSSPDVKNSTVRPVSYIEKTSL